MEKTNLCEIKKCRKCGNTKAASSFYKDARAKDKLTRLCKLCTKKKATEWAKAHKEERTQYMKQYGVDNAEKQRMYRRIWGHKNSRKLAESKRKWVEQNPEKDKSRRLYYKFGITLDDYERMLKEQSGLCAICNHVSDDGIQLCVDHNHKNGEVRGLLCRKCNSGIALLKESRELFESAMKYLGI